MITYLFIIVHLIIIVAFSILLDKKGLSKKFSIFTGFIIAGILFGSITYFIDGYESRVLINPVGARVADWLHDNWDPAYKDPDQFTRDPVIPWLLRFPQTYLFTTIWVYTIIGGFSWIANVINKVDPTRRYLSSSIDAKEFHSKPEAQSESMPE